MSASPPLGHDALSTLFVPFSVLLTVARAVDGLAGRVGLSPVVGELSTGVVLGPPVLGTVAPDAMSGLFPPARQHLLKAVSWLGVVLLLVLAGLETDLALRRRPVVPTAAVAMAGIIVPFALGYVTAPFLPVSVLGPPANLPVVVLFLATATSILAVPIIVRVLDDTGLAQRPVGQVIVAVLLTDVIGWILLALVSGFARTGRVDAVAAERSTLALAAVIVGAAVVGRPAVRALFRRLARS